MDVLKRAAEEIECFERPSAATSREMMEEITRLRSENEKLKSYLPKHGKGFVGV
jgi:hypothetical protein